MKSSVAVFAVVTCLSCSSSDDGSATTSSGGTGGDSAYNTFKGTFVAPGINATIAGSIQGTDNSTATGMSAWNGVSTFVRDSSGLPPPELVATWAAPSGDVTAVTVNISDIEGALVDGTFDCSSNANGAMVAVEFQVHGADGSVVWNYGATTCTITLQAPLTKVVSNGVTVYFSHGTLTANLASILPGAETPNGTGVMNATW